MTHSCTLTQTKKKYYISTDKKKGNSFLIMKGNVNESFEYNLIINLNTKHVIKLVIF